MSCCDHRLLKELGRKPDSAIPVPTRTIVGKQIIPVMPPITPDALTHGNKGSGCGGHFNIMTAYGKNAGNCDQQYFVRPCPGYSNGNQMMGGMRENFRYGRRC